MMSLGLYIHIPFCLQRCLYCDFFTSPLTQEREVIVPSFVDALIVELEAQASLFSGRILHSIFFGGGTPSLLKPREIGFILEKAYMLFEVDEALEVSLEANPETLSLEKIQGFRDVGVNRISMGIQALNDDDLVSLGRVHTLEKALKNYETLRNVGFDNINLDFIYGRPTQTLEAWSRELDAIIALDTEHLSLYELTVEQGTPLQKALEKGEIELPDEDVKLEMYRLVREKLQKGGFQWYEVSNYAKTGYQSRHNVDNWRGGEYLGLGAGAHSFGELSTFGSRRQNPRNLSIYLKDPIAAKWEKRSHEMLYAEALMNGLRLREGLSSKTFEEQYKIPFSEIPLTKLEKLQKEGYMMRDEERWILSFRGVELLDSVVSYLVGVE